MSRTDLTASLKYYVDKNAKFLSSFLTKINYTIRMFAKKYV